MKVLTVVGVRPQLVKAAVVSRAFERCAQEDPEWPVHEVIVHTRSTSMGICPTSSLRNRSAGGGPLWATAHRIVRGLIEWTRGAPEE